MKTRILAAAVLLPVFLVILLVLPAVFTAILFALIALLGAVELLSGTKLIRQPRLVAYSALFAAVIPVWSYFGCHHAWGILIVLAFFCLMFMEIMLSGMKLRVEKVALCMVAALVIPYLLSAVVRIRTMNGGKCLVLLPFVISMLSDTGAYFIGCKFGKHKMAPVISPKKSVEGLFGGVATAVVGMLIYTLIMQLAFDFSVNYFYAILYGLVGSFAGVFGDLCFSAVKRQVDIKDYANLIPGHGGALDRFDSAIVVAPLVEALLILLPVVTK